MKFYIDAKFIERPVIHSERLSTSDSVFGNINKPQPPTLPSDDSSVTFVTKSSS